MRPLEIVHEPVRVSEVVDKYFFLLQLKTNAQLAV